MNPTIDRTSAIPALSNQSGRANVPGLRRLWLIEARHTSGLLDPRTVPNATAGGWLVSDQGLQLTDDAVIHDWRFPSGRSEYQEKAATTIQGISFNQSIKLNIPNDHPLMAQAMRLMLGRKWLAIYTDGNDLSRLVGTPKQPLRFEYQQTIGNNTRALTWQADTRLPAMYLTEADQMLFDGYLKYQYDFSRL